MQIKNGLVRAIASAFLLSTTSAYADGPTNDCSGHICWGILAVPFKAELSGNQDVFGAATVGGYFGWQFPVGEIKLTPIGFAGYSQNIGTDASTNTSFVTYGGGVLVPVGITKMLEFGVVVGFDHTASSNNYAYNDKPWVSALIAVPLNPSQ